ncbi:hypothetical protein [Thiomicrorhabdus sediminis]|uniref:Uncharacterized protein n=1 Tax=Thiomicrorhabdus sediminis TaxID=2580412 RepID=A0A4P9K544_9GAMM|nr:hypothetical protein [Thiomicrorhabdus sediminis]QCU90089.1 hypothetical protein FE785_05295 [Thiomicrorhabdus sediminis]
MRPIKNLSIGYLNKQNLVMLCAALLAAGCFNAAKAQPPANSAIKPLTLAPLSESEQQWVADRVYQNECASNPKYLTYWSQAEEFPSFGIGHFIWYRQGQEQIYQQTFPQMVAYVSQYQAPPKWLAELKPFVAPWRNKAEFDQQSDSLQMRQLRDWLLASRRWQGAFIVDQFTQRVASGLQRPSLRPRQRLRYNAIIERMLSFKQGRFALIDYVNFKGIGNSQEQYQGEQWGLFSVLEQMTSIDIDGLSNRVLLQKFIDAAKARLQRRVELAPKHRAEQRWLTGWFKRLDAYGKD